MNVFVDLSAGWAPSVAADLARHGAIPVVEVPVPDAGPVCARNPAHARRNDHVLLALAVIDAPDRTLLDAFVEAARARGAVPWAVVHTPDQVGAAASAGCRLWLRGYEAAGRVSPFTALVLIRAAHGRAPYVVEGLGPRAMAAAVATGACGVVVGPELWALAASPVQGFDRARSGRDTVVEGHEADAPVRMLAGPGAQPAPQNVAEAGANAHHRDPVAVVEAVRERIGRHLDLVRAGHPLSAGLDPLGTGTPVVQGPMANVAEGTGLAHAVRSAGAMPFAALGALDPAQAEAVVAAMAARIDAPWGVGVIGFEMMPYRDAHLELARAHGASAVILAGATPDFAARVAGEGVQPWLHTPSGRLVSRALGLGVPAVVLEGHEAGGHVGHLTSVGLWEEGLDAVEDAGGSPLVVLAGGIGDPVSAAFAAAMAAPAHHGGARVALQAGTAFFFTEEIAAAGQITPEYQQVALRADTTHLVGATVNLPLRCAANPYVHHARALERAWLDQGVPSRERRERMEHHNLGRTRIAAKGIERNPGRTGPSDDRYREVPGDRRMTDGAFTMGQGATVTAEVRTVAAVVADLTAGARAVLAAARPWGTPRAVAGTPSLDVSADGSVISLRPKRGDAFAVVGLGCVVPGALDVQTFWANLVRGLGAIEEIPPDRWDVDRYWDPTAGTKGPPRSVSRLAGAVRGFRFEPLRYRIPPNVAPTLDPSQRLALAASEQALTDAGWLEGGLDVQRAAVVLGNSMGGEYAKDLALKVRYGEVMDAVLAERGITLSGDDHARLYDAVGDRIETSLPPFESNSMAGVLSSVIAGRVAAWLDWQGGTMTVDAACAASLAALCVSVDWLRAGRCDAVLTGGVDTDLSAQTFIGFTRSLALSSATSRPFSAHADGFVMGEGCGVLALKRLSDALADGDPVWAVIRGVGQASDGRSKGITAPRYLGQQLAIERAFAEAGFTPGDIGMVEAHGTGTGLGDRVEASVLREMFVDAPGPVWLGSVKSNVGHLKSAAGAAGLIKAILSVATGVIPPTLEAGPVNPALRLDEGPLRLPRLPVPFPGDGPRRASVSAFGFGGTNFHVIVEQAPAEANRPAVLDALVADAAPLVEADPVAAAWPFDDAVSRGVTLLVPGQGSQRPGVLARLSTLPAAATALAALEAHLPGAAARAGLDARTWAELDAIGGADTRVLHLVLFAAAVGWSAALADAGVPIQGTVGHSLGEYGALVAAGRLGAVDGLMLVAARGAALHACPPGAMVAVAADEAQAEAMAAEAGLALAAVNAPGACVLAGAPDAVDAFVAAHGPQAWRLGVSRAFHSQLVAPAAAALEDALSAVTFLAGDVPCWSGHSGLPFGEHPATDLLAALTTPVRFAAAAGGAGGPYVELGPGRVLTGLVRRIAPSQACVPVDGRGEDGLRQAAEALAAAGFPQLARALPRQPREAAPAPRPQASAELQATARAVQDLRIAALADPALTPAYEQARAALVASLAVADSGAAGGTAGAPALPASPTTPAAAQQAEPAPAEAPVAPAAGDVRAAVVAAICDITGYPVAYLDDARDLEADLGIDSIRKMEILGVLQDRLGFVAEEADYAELADIDFDGLVAYVRRACAGERPTAAPAATPRGPAAYRLVRLPIPDAVGGGQVPPDGFSRRGDQLVWVSPAEGDVVDTALAVVLAWRAAEQAPRVCVVVRGGPGAHAGAGFARSLGREWGAPVRVIEAEGPPARWAAEVDAADRPPHVVVGAHATWAVHAVPAEPCDPVLVDSPVVLATGGVRGIVAACLIALAERAPRVMLLGRSEAPEAHLDALIDAGLDVVYRRCDVTDAGAVRAAAEALRERHGRIDVVIHGAGVLADAPVSKLTPDQLSAVLDPKVRGAANLFEATAADAPSLWVAFSSVVARGGNPGQAAYGAANAVIEAWRHPTAARSLALAWTAWSGVGMASGAGLQRLLAARGVTAITPEQGGRLFAEALGLDGTVALTADAPSAPPLPWPLAGVDHLGVGRGRFGVRLDPRDPVLADHKVGGRALVPAALWIGALLSAARATHPVPGPRAVTAFQVHVPTFVTAHRQVVVEVDGDRAVVLAGDTVVAEARIEACHPPDRGPPPAPLGRSRAAAPLYRHDLLFHGHTWQVLDRVQTDGNGDVHADLVPANGLDVVASAVDAAHQVLSAWAGRATGFLGLPVGAQRWVVDAPDAGPLRLEASARADGDDVVGEVRAVAPSGRVVLSGETVRLRRATRWPADAPDTLDAPDA